jgi:hypothetical protein
MYSREKEGKDATDPEYNKKRRQSRQPEFYAATFSTGPSSSRAKVSASARNKLAKDDDGRVYVGSGETRERESDPEEPPARMTDDSDDKGSGRESSTGSTGSGEMCSVQLNGCIC